ncbi:hypothetical protein CsatB_018593 [Cannabis sativa]|uniref:uncharacterized protein LOC133035536 n=1 Tax=Cannabis sativa TaxID=3483 RepID=UPI0029CA9967|nr:uncharacterized protein LOC133035536 [Cannabis sativa]
MYSWTIWKARNKVVWKKKHSSVNDVLTSAQVALDHWNKAHDKILLSSICLENIGDSAESWTKPVENTIKINVDAALFDIDNKYGFEIIAQNYLGYLVAARAGCHGGRYAAEVIEVMGIKKALSWVKTNNWQHVQIETANLVSVQAIRSNQAMKSTFALSIKDCQLLLSTLPNVNLFFIRRSANRVAHYVAKHSRYQSDRNISDISISGELLHLLHSEC